MKAAGCYGHPNRCENNRILAHRNCINRSCSRPANYSPAACGTRITIPSSFEGEGRRGRRGDSAGDHRKRGADWISISSRAREVCEICGNDWPSEYGTKCHKCGHIPSTWTPGDEPKADDKPTDEPKGCTCGDAYHNSYGRRCVDCEGEPSAARRSSRERRWGGV